MKSPHIVQSLATPYGYQIYLVGVSCASYYLESEQSKIMYDLSIDRTIFKLHCFLKLEIAHNCFKADFVNYKTKHKRNPQKLSEGL